MSITIYGIEFETAAEALQHVNAAGRGHAISVANTYMVVERAEADRLETAGVYFAYLHDVELPDGTYRTVSVPVNDDDRD